MTAMSWIIEKEGIEMLVERTGSNPKNCRPWFQNHEQEERLYVWDKWNYNSIRKDPWSENVGSWCHEHDGRFQAYWFVVLSGKIA